jgi:hypothetical protein
MCVCVCESVSESECGGVGGGGGGDQDLGILKSCFGLGGHIGKRVLSTAQICLLL